MSKVKKVNQVESVKEDQVVPESHICPDCNKSFKTKSALKVHVKTHDDMHQKSDELTKVIQTEKQEKDAVALNLKQTKVELQKIKDRLQAIKLDIEEQIHAIDLLC